MPTEPVNQKPAPPAAKPKIVGYGFSCGSGRPCKVFNVYENEAEPPKLPAPTEPTRER